VLIFNVGFGVFPFKSDTQAEFIAWSAFGRPLGRAKMDLLLKFQKEHIQDVTKIASSHKSLIRFMSNTLPILPMSSHVVKVSKPRALFLIAYHNYALIICLHICMQVSETKDYENDADEDNQPHIKVHIVDIKAAIQRMFLNPNTPWDKARPSDVHRSFSNVPFAQVLTLPMPRSS
jgi:hypothetical protein